jgi:hypothetical protein
MKVICIRTEAPETPDPELVIASLEMYVGRVVTVIDEGEEYGGWYEFDEYPDLFWYKENFVPLSDIDETEIAKEREVVECY